MLAHEVAHVANGDMVTLTLIQGVVNTFVFFLARVIGHFVDSAMRKDDEESSGPGMAYFATVIVMELTLGLLASIIVMFYSRQRRLRAVAGPPPAHDQRTAPSGQPAGRRTAQQHGSFRHQRQRRPDGLVFKPPTARGPHSGPEPTPLITGH